MLPGAPPLQRPPGEAAQAEPESAPAHSVGPTRRSLRQGPEADHRVAPGGVAQDLL